MQRARASKGAPQVAKLWPCSAPTSSSQRQAFMQECERFRESTPSVLSRSWTVLMAQTQCVRSGNKR